MREIIFRGKNSKGEWLYGDLLQLNKQVFIAPADGDWFDFMPHNKSSFGIPSGNYRVAPSSVGQFTGLLDKNGTKIFEGDILKCMDVFAVVTFIKGDFCITSPNCCDACKKFEGAISSLNEALVFYECEILGNIHDNPELLKGE